MSEHLFGVGRRAVTDEQGEAISAVAEEHGATFVWTKMPEGPLYWFACTNLGSPFDEATVWAALMAAGLADANDLVLESES